MPESVQISLFKDFLYERFLHVFSTNFTIQKLKAHEFHTYYRWDSHHYINFMIEFMSSLEPILYQKGEIVVNEL